MGTPTVEALPTTPLQNDFNVSSENKVSQRTCPVNVHLISGPGIGTMSNFDQFDRAVR